MYISREMEIQAKIATAVVNRMQEGLSLNNIELRVTENELKYLGRIPTQNQEAYEYYLKGRSFWVQRGTALDEFEHALENFERATELDPEFAEAYAFQSIIHSFFEL